MSKYTRWEQGRLLDTKETLRWSGEERYMADLRERCKIYVGFDEKDQGRSRHRIAKCDDIVTTERMVAEHNAMIDRIEHLEKLAAEFLWEEEYGLGKIEPSKPMCEPCAQGNCRACRGHKVCDHYHAWEGEDEERALCGMPISKDGILTCKRPFGHTDYCWASR